MGTLHLDIKVTVIQKKIVKHILMQDMQHFVSELCRNIEIKGVHLPKTKKKNMRSAHNNTTRINDKKNLSILSTSEVM